MGELPKHIPRPDYGLYDPHVEGNKFWYLFLNTIAAILFIGFSVYSIVSFLRIIKLSFISFVGNLVMLVIEIMLGLYSIILLWHLAKGFAKVDAKLDPIISREDLSNGKVPMVSILVMCYKEPLKIVEQTVKAAMDIHYPEDKYEVMVMEDGRQNDKIENFCGHIGARYLTRDNRKNFKAGAANFALPQLKGDYVLFLDADHIVERNIVANCLLSWREGTIGIQTRVDFVNMLTYLTTISAFLQIQFFSLFERGRRSSGSAIFAGGGAMFDRNLLLDFGGLNTDTIADDTDTSFILRYEGYRIEYIDTIGVWGLVPWDPLHLIRQVWRWWTGITRSWKNNWLSILRGQSSVYSRVDHFATAFFPVLSVVGWLVGFILVIMIELQIPLVRASDIGFGGLIAISASIIGMLPVITGTAALYLDDKHISFRQKSRFTQITTLGGFYLLVVAAQPLLIGAILKGLLGINVEFNRTPKEKKVTDNDIDKYKLQYLLYSIVIFIIGVIFILYALNLKLGDSRQIALLIGGYAGIVPIIIALLWFWKLERYLLEVGDISALKFLEEKSNKTSN